MKRQFTSTRVMPRHFGVVVDGGGDDDEGDGDGDDVDGDDDDHDDDM